MGHDHHFLERLDRVEQQELTLALDLYRNHEAVRYVLARIRIPEGAPRVALCLGPDPSQGPWAIVARDGGFVTCLGKGMRTGDLPIVPRGQLDALVARHDAQRQRIGEATASISRFGGAGPFFERAFERASSMSREDFIALSAFAPILAARFHSGAIQHAVSIPTRMRALLGVSGIAPAHRESAKRLHSHFWGVGHQLLLAGAGEHLDFESVLGDRLGRDTGVSFFTLFLNSTTTLLRGLHIGARLGKIALPSYKAAAARGNDEGSIVDGLWGATAVAFRHSGAMAEVRRMLQSRNEGGVLQAYRERHARIVLDVLDDPEPQTAAALDWGRAHFRSRVRAAGLPADDRHSYASDADVPDDLARTAVLSYDGAVLTSRRDLRLALAALYLAARAKPEDFYFSREVMKKIDTPWTPSQTIALAARFSDDMFRKKPRTSEPSPGRNDPCRCGSGKKHKKCCAMQPASRPGERALSA